MNNETRGIIMFNRGDRCIVRAIVALNTLRRHWQGPVTFYLEDPYPHEFDEVCAKYNVDVVHNDKKHELKTLVRKTDMFANPPYDRTMWLDCDVVITGSISEMFDYLDDHDVSIPHFCGWKSNGRTMAKRVKKFEGIAEDRHIKKALEDNPAVNTGILSFRKTENWARFAKYWVDLAEKGSKARIFIPDEVAFQVLYPSAEEWGLRTHIAPQKFNVSVKYGEDVEDKRVVHFHGKKHCLEFPNCDYWKNEFESMRENNTANINSYLKYADKRLKKYLNVKDGLVSDVTIVTACDEIYIEFLKMTFPNWRKYKNIDNHPVMIFVHGIPLDDERLDFLRFPNVELIEWSFPEAESHREEMLSAFVFGTAENVKTDYWLKLDCDSYATNDKPLYSEKMKQYAYCGHKWSYSRPSHIEGLDEWAKGHWKKKLKNAKPMIEEGRIDGRRFFHDTKRTISFIQLHKLKFTKFCVSLCRERRLPVPTQDTFMFFVCNRFDPHLGGTANFKRDHGFAQGNSRRGPEVLAEKMKLVEIENGFMLEDGTIVEDVLGTTEDIYDGVEEPNSYTYMAAAAKKLSEEKKEVIPDPPEPVKVKNSDVFINLTKELKAISDHPKAVSLDDEEFIVVIREIE